MTDKKDETQSVPNRPSAHKRQRDKAQIPEETRAEILRLHEFYGTREIARRVGWSRKIIRRILGEEGCLDPPHPTHRASKLDPFRETIESKVEKGLTVTRILREIREEGYSGGRSILADSVRTLRAKFALAPTKTVKRRFETRPGEEIQIDWSPYRIEIAGVVRTVHALGCLLCASRKLWVHFYRDERQPTLLEGLAGAFEYFQGCSLRVVLDNMATAVLGRYGANGKPIWHPRFVDFARHYGFEPFACAVRDPDRKGKKEKSFRLLWDDFLKGSQFDSLDELNQRVKLWLDATPEVANQRVHGTTRLVPNEAWLSERDFLIQLPDKRFPVYEQSIRVVDEDSTLSIRGTRYTVPSLAGRSLALRLFAEHFEVLDSHLHVVFSRRYVPEADKGKLIIDPTHYETQKRRPRTNATRRLDEAFVKRFPSLVSFVSGLQQRMKGLAPIHIRALLRLVDSYGEEAFLAAATRAQDYRRFDARAVERILERHYPMLDDVPLAPLGGVGAVLVGDVDPGSLDDYGQLDLESTSNHSQVDLDDSEANHGS